jgi:hypothetical protein
MFFTGGQYDQPHLMSGGRYPVLRALAILYLIGAAVFVVAGIASLVWSLWRAPGMWTDRLILAGGAIAATFILAISALAVAELLKLFIDIEHNTRMISMAEPAAANAIPVSLGRSDRLLWLDEETAEGALMRGR